MSAALSHFRLLLLRGWRSLGWTWLSSQIKHSTKDSASSSVHASHPLANRQVYITDVDRVAGKYHCYVHNYKGGSPVWWHSAMVYNSLKGHCMIISLIDFWFFFFFWGGGLSRSGHSETSHFCSSWVTFSLYPIYCAIERSHTDKVKGEDGWTLSTMVSYSQGSAATMFSVSTLCLGKPWLMPQRNSDHGGPHSAVVAQVVLVKSFVVRCSEFN